MSTLRNLLLVAFVICAASAKIGVRDGLTDFQMLPSDVADFDLKRVFDLSQAKGRVKYNTNIGKTFNHGQPFATKNLAFLHLEKPNSIKSHDYWVTSVFDNNKVLFQTVDNSGKKLLDYQLADLNKFGANLVCTSTAYNKYRNYIYIGCFDKNSTDSNPGAVYIFTWDLNAAAVVAEVSVRQNDGFRVVNSLSIFLESFPQGDGNDDQVYLIAYDQGHTLQAQTRKNQAARVFFNVQSG
jgi:hypothetical protein